MNSGISKSRNRLTHHGFSTNWDGCKCKEMGFRRRRSAEFSALKAGNAKRSLNFSGRPTGTALSGLKFALRSGRGIGVPVRSVLPELQILLGGVATTSVPEGPGAMSMLGPGFLRGRVSGLGAGCGAASFCSGFSSRAVFSRRSSSCSFSLIPKTNLDYETHNRTVLFCFGKRMGYEPGIHRHQRVVLQELGQCVLPRGRAEKPASWSITKPSSPRLKSTPLFTDSRPSR